MRTGAYFKEECKQIYPDMQIIDQLPNRKIGLVLYKKELPEGILRNVYLKKYVFREEECIEKVP